MMGLVIAIHVISCVILITIVLVQRGRGGGFVENLSGLENMFGTKTSAILTKATTICAVVFFITCLLLALQGVNRSRSLMEGVRPAPASAPVSAPVPASTPTPAPTEATPAASK
ncbi:MAG TPA: preprotein translocase subunit SecG [Candidatus Omnitrophota bacterium]|nr:preprotein translocase subunit SecG [Candidatus Omnitrophota bacterium]HRZ15681.1 preprotein translocase subunit SecG [Candidatus Omnitrophota bacterium]